MIQFPIGTVGKIFAGDTLPAYLKAHGSLIVITGRPRLPDLTISQTSHAIVKFCGSGQPGGGWLAVEVAADSVARGGAGWLSFSTLRDAQAYIRLFGRKSNISFLPS